VGTALATKKNRIFNRVLFGGIGFAGLVAIAPIIPMLLGALIKSMFHCEGNESGTYPCVVAGVDFGGLVAFGSVSPWMLFFSFPAGMVLGGVVVVVMMLINWKFNLNA